MGLVIMPGTAVLFPTGSTCATSSCEPLRMWIGFCAVPIPPTFRCRCRPSMSWSSTSRPPRHSGSKSRHASRARRRGDRMSNCVVGSGGLRLPCSTIAEHRVEGCDHFSHDGDDDLGFFVGVGEAIVEGFEGGTVSARAEGGHVEDITDRHPTTVDAAVSLKLAAVEVIGCEADEGGDL